MHFEYYGWVEIKFDFNALISMKLPPSPPIKQNWHSSLGLGDESVNNFAILFGVVGKTSIFDSILGSLNYIFQESKVLLHNLQFDCNREIYDTSVTKTITDDGFNLKVVIKLFYFNFILIIFFWKVVGEVKKEISDVTVLYILSNPQFQEFWNFDISRLIYEFSFGTQ